MNYSLFSNSKDLRLFKANFKTTSHNLSIDGFV